MISLGWASSFKIFLFTKLHIGRPTEKVNNCWPCVWLLLKATSIHLQKQYGNQNLLAQFSSRQLFPRPCHLGALFYFLVISLWERNSETTRHHREGRFWNEGTLKFALRPDCCTESCNSMHGAECIAVLASFTTIWHILESSESRDPQLRKCLCKIKLSECIFIFSGWLWVMLSLD